jgi:YegS/Rv2252/BmrU family lipid kinase
VSTRTIVVVNPHSRSGATARRWKSVAKRVRALLGELAVEYTRGPRDAERIAREGAARGAGRIVVAGGDGTTSEVVTGLLSAGLGEKVELGLLPLGTGGDLARTLGVPRALDRAIEALARGTTRRADAGRLRYRDRSGKDSEAFFLNVASAGIGGLVDELVNQTPKTLGGRISFLVGTLRAVARYRNVEVSIRLDGEPVYSGRIVLAAAANGRFFGGGMHIAPEARIDDGALDLVVVKDLTIWEMLRRLPDLYAGRHLSHPDVLFARGSRIEIEAAPGEARLDIDGEPLGSAPAEFEILPGAIRLFGVG